MSDETVRVPAALVEAARHPYKGPNDTDASMLRAAADRIRDLYAPGGSNTREQVVRVLNSVADLLDAAERPDGGCCTCGESVPTVTTPGPCYWAENAPGVESQVHCPPPAPVSEPSMCSHGTPLAFRCPPCEGWTDMSATPAPLSSPRRTRDEGTEDEAEEAWEAWVNSPEHEYRTNLDRLSFLAGFKRGRADQ